MTRTEKDSLKEGGFVAWYLKSRTLALLILLVFLLILGVASYQGVQHYRNRLTQIRASNQTAANLLALFIGEHQKAAVDVLRSYATRPLLVQAAKSRQPERAREHLISLAKENPEFATLIITDREGTIGVSHPPRPEMPNLSRLTKRALRSERVKRNLYAEPITDACPRLFRRNVFQLDD